MDTNKLLFDNFWGKTIDLNTKAINGRTQFWEEFKKNFYYNLNVTTLQRNLIERENSLVIFSRILSCIIHGIFFVL